VSNKNREVSNFATLILAPSQRNLRIFAHGRRRFMVVGAPRRELGTTVIPGVTQAQVLALSFSKIQE